MNVRRISDTGFNGAIHIALEPRRFGYSSDFFGFKKPAGFGGVNRDHIRRFLLDNFHNILSCPGAFVGHDRRIDSLCNFRHLVDALHRLFHVEQVVLRHRFRHLDRNLWCWIPLVGINTDLGFGTKSIAHAPNQFHVPFRIDATLV